MPLPYGMRDPFAEINARLRKLGLQPITMGGAPAVPDIAAMYQRPLSTPSPVEAEQAIAEQAKASGPMYNQLTPEAEAGVMEKISGGLLSGLELIGRTLDSITGARAIRGVLGGNFREILSAGPFAGWSDVVGLTDPKDIIGGRELMEKAGILEENKPGLDWGDVGGFVGEVLLDPSTYFFGAGLLTKGVQAGTKAGKALSKIGVLDDVLRKGTTNDKLLSSLLAVRKDKVSIKALEDIASGAAKKGGGTGIRMGQRQLGRRLDVRDILRVDDEITAALGRSGKESLEETETLARSFRGMDNRPVREVLEESVGGPEELARLMKDEWVLPGGEAGSMPLTSHWSMGFPKLFTGGGKEGTKGIRQALFSNLPDVMTRKQYFPSLDKGFGKNIDAFAGRFDVAGDIIRFGKYTPIRGAATLFNPRLKWNAKTEIAQRAILNDISRGERHIKQANTALYGIESELRLDHFLEKEHYMETMGLSAEAAERRVAEQAHDFYSALEGFGIQRIPDPSDPAKPKIVIPQLPTHDINKAPKIRRIAEVNFYTAKTRYNSVTKQLNNTVDLQKREPARLRGEDVAEEVIETTMRQFDTDIDLLVRAQREAKEMGTEWQKVMDDLDVLLDVEGGGKSPTYSDYQTATDAGGSPIAHPGKHLEAIENAERFGLDNADEIIVRMKNLKKKFNQGPPEGLPKPDDIKGYVQGIEVYEVGGKRKKIGAAWFDAPKGGVHDRSFPKLSESLSKLPGKLGIRDPEGVTHLEKLMVRLTYYGQEALDRAAAAGMDTSELSDTWSLFHPRSAEEPVQKGLRGYVEKARTAKNLKSKMHAAERASPTGAARRQTENLNPISSRMKRRRTYLQNIFGGTNTLNYFYSKFGGERLKRIVGDHILTDKPTNKVIDSIVNDDHWFHTLQNPEYVDHLLDDGVVIKINMEPGKHIKLPVDSTGVEAQIIGTKWVNRDEMVEGVYVNRNSNAIKNLAESILDKDASLGEGVKLFSTDPIRSMIGYYGDVIKASVAADIVLEIASKNAYFNLLKHLEVPTGEGNPYSVAKILSDTKLDTVIGKRKFIDRLRSERPEQWDHFLDVWTKPLDELAIEHPELVETMRQARKDYPDAHDFIKKLRDEPDKIGIEIHDEVRSALPGDGETYTVQAKNLYRNGELIDTEDLTKPRDGGPTTPDVDPDSLSRSAGVDPDDLSTTKPEPTEPTPEYMVDHEIWDEAAEVLGPKADGYSPEDINWYKSMKRQLIEEGEEDADDILREMYKDRQSAPAAEVAPPVNPAAPTPAKVPVSAQQQVDKIIDDTIPKAPEVTQAPSPARHEDFITHESVDGYKKMEAALPPSGHQFIGGEDVGWAGGPVISPDGEVMWSIGNPEGSMIEYVADSAIPLSHPSVRAELVDGLKRQAGYERDNLKRAIERGPDGDSRIEIFEYESEIENLKSWIKEAESGETLDQFDKFVRDVEAAKPAAPTPARAVEAVAPPGSFAPLVGLTPKSVQDMRGVIDNLRRTKMTMEDAIAQSEIFYDTGIFHIKDSTSDIRRKGKWGEMLLQRGLDGKWEPKTNWQEKFAKLLEGRLNTKLDNLKEPSVTRKVDDILTEAKGGVKPVDDIVEMDYGESVDSLREVVEVNAHDTTRQGMNRQEKDFYDTVKLGRTNPRATFAYVKIHPSTQDAIVKRMQAQADHATKRGYELEIVYDAEAFNSLIEKINSSTKNNKNLVNLSIREMQAIWEATLDNLDGSAPFAGTAGTNARKIHNDVEGLISGWQLRGGTQNVKPGGIGGPGYLNTKGDFQFLSTKQKKEVRAYQKRLKLDESIPTSKPVRPEAPAPAVTKKPTAPIEQPPVTPTGVGPGETLADQEYAALQKLREGPVEMGPIQRQLRADEVAANEAAVLLEKASTIPGFGKLDIKDIPTSPAPTRELSIIKGREIETVLPEPPVGRHAATTQSTEPLRAGFVDDAAPAARAPVDGDKNGWYLVLDGLDGDHPIERYAQKHYIPNSVLRNTKDIGPGEAVESLSDVLLKNFEIEGELADDLKRYLNTFQKRDITNDIVAGLDWFTDIFKDMATSLWPAFHFRNFASGQVNNMFSGAYDPRYRGPRRWTQPVMDAMAMAEGKTIVGLIELDVFKAMKGIDTDQQATQYLVDLAVGHGLIGPGQHLSDLQQVATGQVHNFLERVGGPNTIIREGAAGGYLGGMAGRIWGAGKLGDEVVGEVLGKTIPGLTGSLPARAGTSYKRMGFHLGNEVEFLNRMSPLIAHIRKGLSPEEAIMKVKLAQVDYRALTPWEKQWMRRVIPFYTFTRRQIPFVIENLLDPSSGMATTAKTVFRTKHAMEDPNEPVPDYISTNVNFPLHKLLGRMGTKEGQARYLTGLGGFLGGLEDVSSLLKPGKGYMDTAQRTVSGIFARMNPAAQLPIETATGVSLFHQRPYKDMKSPTARLIGEASGSEFVPRWPTSEWDMLFHKLPGYGRSISTARTLMDRTRKPILDEEGNFSVGNLLARTVPTVMGSRVTEVSMDRIKNRLLQNRLEEILSGNPSMVKFSQIYIPQDKLGALSQEELEAYMLYKKLGAAAARASYARKKAAEYSN